MLGRYDVRELAPLALAGTMMFIVMIIGGGFAIAVSPLVAEAEEEDDQLTSRRVTRMALWLVTAYSIVVMPLFFYAGPLLEAAGQQPEVALSAQTYLTIAVFTMAPNLMIMTLRSFLAALEHASVILWTNIGAALANVLFNYILIFGNWGAPELGLRGAALASVGSVVVTLLLLVMYVRWRLPERALFERLWVMDRDAMWRVAKLGLPIGMTTLAEGSLFAASSLMMGWIGTIELATHGIALQVASIVFMVYLGLSQAATVRAGRALGRKDWAGLNRGAVLIMAVTVAIAGVFIAAFLIVPEPILSIFMRADETERGQILALGTTLLALAALFQAVDAGQVMLLGLLRGIQDTTVPFIMAVIGYWIIGFPVAYALAFPLGMGPAGLWLGLCVGLLAACVLMGTRLIVMLRRLSS